MLPKERVIRAIEHKEPDRVPTGEIGIDYPITEKVLGRQTYCRAGWRELTALWEGKRDLVLESYKRDLVDLVKKLELDIVSVPLVPSQKAKIVKPEFLDAYTWKDREGNIWKFPIESGNIWPMCMKHREISIDDIDVSAKLDVDESQLALVRYVKKKLGGTHFILGRTMDGSFPVEEPMIMNLTGGLVNFLTKMALEPAFVEKVTRVATKQSIELGKMFIEAGCDGVCLGADYCGNNGPLMSPDHFRRFICPSLREQCEQFHKEGAYVIKHTDGDTRPILDMMVEAGIDGWQGIQLSLGIDMKELKEKYGNEICLLGGVDCSTLTDGSIRQVKDEVRYAIEHAARGGGLVITSGNTIMAGVKYENYLAMLDTIKKEGIYLK